MTTLSLKISPTLMQSIVQTMFVGTPIHLGIITVGNNIADSLVETTPEAFRAIEYNSGSWTRPQLTLGASGSFNAGLDKWEFPTSAWSLTGPPGGISIKQVVVILGGTTTPRNNTGVIVGVGTYTVPIDIAANAVQTIEVPWSIS